MGCGWPGDLTGRPDLSSYLTTSTAAATYTPLSEIVERAQDAAAAMFRAGTNVTFTYDDAANTFTINASGGGAGSTDPEVVRDTIGGALVGGANITITVNDPADTITIAVTGLATVATSGSYADLSNKPSIPTVGAAGAGAGVALSSTDASVTNARTPTAHASTHAAGGSDPVSPASIGAENAGAAASAHNYSIQRANHAGTQPATTITGLAAVATSGSKADVGLGNVANLTPAALADSDDFALVYAPRVSVIDTVITANTALTANRHHKVDASGGPVTVTLPTPTRLGQRIRVEKADTSANLVSITGTIRGTTATITLLSQYRTIEFFAESLTSWRTANSHHTDASLDARYERLVTRGSATAGQVPTLQSDGTLAFTTIPGGGGGTSAGAMPGAYPISGRWWTSQGPWLDDSNANLGDGTLRLSSFVLGKATTFRSIACNVTNAGSTGSVVRAAVYGDSAGMPGSLVYGTAAMDSTSTGDKVVDGINLSLPIGRYWLGLVQQGAPSTNPQVRTFSGEKIATTLLGGNAGNPFLPHGNPGFQVPNVTGALPATASGFTYINGTMTIPQVWLRAT